ncbi:unnamed protein product [Prunus armeniaca]
MVLIETFQVAAIIAKLPPSWKDFKNYLKYKRKEMGLEDLIARLRIEEDNRGSEKKTSGNSMVAKAHVVEDGLTNKKKRKHSGEGSSQGNSKKNKGFKGKCFNCNKHGHRAVNCQSKGKPKEVHMTEEEKLSNEIYDINLLVVIFAMNLEDVYYLSTTEPKGATVHGKLINFQGLRTRKGGFEDDFWQGTHPKPSASCA